MQVPRARGRRPRGVTTRSDIVSAALAVADRVGVDRLTMRAVAKVAKVPTMSLYSHFSNKAELLDLMVTEVKRRLFIEEACDTWQEELRATSRRIRVVLIEHPRWVPLLLRPVPPQRVRWWESMLARLQADGLTVGPALGALSGAVLLAEGLVLLELALTRAPSSSLALSIDRSRDWLTHVAPVGRATDRAELAGLGQFDLAHNFALTMRAYTAGLETAGTRPL
jgi:AcrR family transcriptional regulator